MIRSPDQKCKQAYNRQTKEHQNDISKATPGPYKADWGNRTLEYRTKEGYRGFLWEPDEETELDINEIEKNLAFAELLDPQTMIMLVTEVLAWRRNGRP